MKPFIDPSFWSDPDIEAQTSGVKLCTLWLFTNSQTSLLGLCSASPGRFTFETKLPAAALERTIEALPRAFLKVDNTIFIRNYVRHQFGSGDKLIRNNFFVALKSLYLSVKNQKLRSLILADYPEFEEALHKPFEGLTKPKERKGKVSTGKGGGVQRGRFTPPTLAEAKAYAATIDFDDVEGWHDHFTSNGWRVGGKAEMKDWQSAMRNAKRHPIHRQNGAAGARAMSAFELEKRIAAAKDKIAVITRQERHFDETCGRNVVPAAAQEEIDKLKENIGQWQNQMIGMQ